MERCSIRYESNSLTIYLKGRIDSTNAPAVVNRSFQGKRRIHRRTRHGGSFPLDGVTERSSMRDLDYARRKEDFIEQTEEITRQGVAP